jgi:acetolactate synthase-1/2/3 large subunit
MAVQTLSNVTVGQAYLRLLAERGIEYVFANAGTDFAPLIEGWAGARAEGTPAPIPVTVPHENVAVAMAMGYWMVSGRMQAVMVHVNVGTANTLCGLLNAAQVQAPMLLAAGRTPITEHGLEGGRNIHIHWTQEMYDQAGMLREMVKWDYELRTGAQLETVVDRALTIADSAPKGPVYLTLPREVLASRMDAFRFQKPARHSAARPQAPDAAGMANLADLLAAAELPLVITSSLGFEHEAPQVLARLAERYALPVVQYVPRCLNLPSSHPMHAGFDPHPLLQEADLVIVLASAVPWIPAQARPRADAKVAHIGVDPLHQRIPIWGFECDLAISSAPVAALRALEVELGARERAMQARVDARRKRIAAKRTERLAALEGAISQARHRTPIDPAWITACIDEVKDDQTILIREAPQFSTQHLKLEKAGTYFSLGGAGGLGWGLGAAIGAKMAAPNSLVIAVVGDGSYMFGVPVAAHYAALELGAPFLTVIMDNQRWNEVAVATRHVYPDGQAAADPKHEPLTYFDPSLRLEKAIETVGGYGERVTDPAELPNALRRAVRVVKEERRQAVLDVVCAR